MKYLYQKAVLFSGLILLLSCIGGFLLSFGSLIPIELVRENTQVSQSDIAYREGTFTDQIWLAQILNDQNYITHLGNALDMNRYSRYWHGQFTILKILFIFMQYDNALLFCSLVLLSFLIFLIYTMTRKIGWQLSIPFLIAVFSTGLYHWRESSLAFMPCPIIALVVLSIILTKKKIHLPELFLTIGACTCYFDILQYPVMTYGFPLLVIVAIWIDKKILDLLKVIIVSGVSWFCGYAGCWFMKWIIIDLVLSKNIIAQGFHIARFRVDGWDFSHFETLKTNFFTFYPFSFSTIILVVGLFTGLLFLYLKIKKRRIIPQTLLFLLIATFPYIWFLVLNNHSAIHCIFVHKIQAVSLMGILLFFAYNISCPRAKMVLTDLKSYSLNKPFFFTIVGLFCFYALSVWYIEKFHRTVKTVQSYDWSAQVDIMDKRIGSSQQIQCDTSACLIDISD